MTQEEIEQLDVIKKERWDRYSEITSAREYGREEGDFQRLSQIVVNLSMNGFEVNAIADLVEEPLHAVKKILGCE
ncbi:MAG: hypothetical protein DA446_03480 [Bacteroidetes bacterium]|jgi:predicted SpoU family rRNA methylase|nr:MAG: hypothetical protein DA446_03480 [Bacteroidota bacterium]